MVGGDTYIQVSGGGVQMVASRGYDLVASGEDTLGV